MQGEWCRTVDGTVERKCKMNKNEEVRTSHTGKMKQSTAVKLLSSLSAAALVLVFGMMAYNMWASNKFDKITMEGDALSSYVEDFVDASSYLTDEVRSYVATGDRIHYDNYWKEVNTDQRREKAVAALKEAGITEEESRWITQIQDLSNGLVPLEDEAMKMVTQGPNLNAVEMVYSGKYKDSVKQIHELEDKLANSIWTRMEA